MKKIIVDTDLGYDVDDAAALAVINILHKRGDVEFCAATHCFSAALAAETLAWINGYYGTDIPVGVAEGKNDTALLKKFICKLGLSQKQKYSLAVEVLKNTLAAAEDKSVVLLCIGQLNNLYDLLCDKDGKRLVEEKISEIVVMGGNFDEYGEFYEYGGIKWKGEFNIVTDIDASQAVMAQAELPLSFVDFNQGVDVELDINTLGLEKGNPIDRIYRLAKLCKRPSWDIVAAFYASGRYDEYFNVSKYGRAYVDGNGRTTFKEGEGRHRLIRLKHDDHIVFAQLIRNFFLKNQ